ncbi:toprim domain-containing protein [Chryseobacterium sp. c4a]|uniref:toprim domain-containing protein n=1 Tax=Chryseobacterium sp. c4a TaxID=1573582 RepID=UPI00135765A5|nr:toprim domain-containing protein [Chryseobacterium sp. c4a]
MNCKQFNSIGLEEVLAALGHLPIRQNDKEAWYLSPFATESQASFKVDRSHNVWYLFSEGIGGTNTDFMQKYLNTTVKGVLEWASSQSFSSFPQQSEQIRKIPTEYRIDKVQELSHPNLLRYLRDRELSSKMYPYLKEIWFTIKDKSYYTIGFENRSGGWEVRNPYYKGALLNKDISILHIDPAVPNANNQKIHPDNVLSVSHDGRLDDKIVVVEGFMDALSFLELKGSYQGDLLVLNSTSLLQKAIDSLKGYSEIFLFLDNDKAGKKSTDKILNIYPHAKDFSHIYSDHKDLNQYLIKKRQRQALPSLKTEGIPKQESDSAKKKESCKEETNRVTKGLRRRM